MKRRSLLAILMTICLVMSLAVCAFATETTGETSEATVAATGETTEATADEATEPAAAETTEAVADETTEPVADASDDEIELPLDEEGEEHDHDHEGEDTLTTGTNEIPEESMGGFKLVLVIVEVITSIALVLVVLMQSGKEAGLSGALSGSSDSYLSKNKNGGLDKILSKSTKWIALVWVVLTLLLSLDLF